MCLVKLCFEITPITFVLIFCRLSQEKGMFSSPNCNINNSTEYSLHSITAAHQTTEDAIGDDNSRQKAISSVVSVTWTVTAPEFFFFWGGGGGRAARRQTVCLRGKNPKICWIQLPFAIFSFWLGGSGERTPDWGKCPHAPLGAFTAHEYHNSCIYWKY